MTDPELQSLFHDVTDYMRTERAETLRVREAQHANVEPVSAAEANAARRLLARGRFSGGICVKCGERRLHAHGIVS